MTTLSEISPEELIDAPEEIVHLHIAMQMLENLNIENKETYQIVIQIVIKELNKVRRKNGLVC